MDQREIRPPARHHDPAGTRSPCSLRRGNLRRRGAPLHVRVRHEDQNTARPDRLAPHGHTPWAHALAIHRELAGTVSVPLPHRRRRGAVGTPMDIRGDPSRPRRGASTRTCVLRTLRSASRQAIRSMGERIGPPHLRGIEKSQVGMTPHPAHLLLRSFTGPKTVAGSAGRSQNRCARLYRLSRWPGVGRGGH
jgi:hypothetical protein